MSDLSSHPHRTQAPSCVSVSVLTVSTTRALEQDSSGDLIEHLLRDAGRHVARRMLVKDDVNQIRKALYTLVGSGTQAVVVTGGTGVTPTDVTIEAVKPLFDKELTAFAILFTQLSYAEVGAAAMLSRATGGIIGKTAIFCLPGSEKACKLAMERIILPELGHLVGHVSPEGCAVPFQ